MGVYRKAVWCTNSNGINLEDRTINERLVYPLMMFSDGRPHIPEKVLDNRIRPMTEDEFVQFTKEAYERTDMHALEVCKRRAKNLNSDVTITWDGRASVSAIVDGGEDRVFIQASSPRKLSYVLGILLDEIH